MKINVSSIFETTQIAKTRAFNEISSFFDYFSVFSSNIIRALNNNIGVKDNLDAAYVTYELYDDRDLEVTLKKEPIGIMLVGYEFSLISDKKKYINGFRWSFTADKKVILNVKYSASSSDSVKVKLIAFYS